jgi:ATP-dependent DNA helicase RecG
MFKREFQQIIEEENKAFLKQALQRKKESEEEEDLRTAIEMPIANYDVSRFSEEALKKFIKEAKLDFKHTDEAFLEYLADFGAMEWDKEKKMYVSTGFGVLLFGKNPRTRFKNAVLKAQVSYGGNKIEPKDFDQALVLLPDQIEEWLLKVLPLSKDVSSFKRKDIPDFPPGVLREAIVNALVHRDYEIEGAKCELIIDENKIIVTSPGKPLPSISLDDLNRFEASSLSRNHIITYAFSLMDYVEEKGFGMKTFKSLNKEYGLPIPKYTFKEPFLTLTFPRTTEAVKEVIGNSRTGDLSTEDLKNFEIFRNKRLVTKTEFVEYSGLPSRTAERHLRDWVDKGLLTIVGSGRSTKYQYNE